VLTPERLASCRKDYDAILADGEAANPRAPPSGKRGLAAGVIEAVRRFRLDGHAADGVGDRVVLVHGCVSLLVWRRAGGDRLIEVSGIS